ncbi:TPA: preprotein translocase subunit SecG [Patescibacteria group bacterium]|nr:preprotein translocase subunit SecG [Patescibacteria group bacterium]HCR41953.1 preprotein translocase subunit SecG [Patescibacteria group bacterium]
MIVQVVLAIILMVSILVQGRGTSLGEAFGGSSSFYTTRRGAERTLFVITIVVAVLFVATALVSLFFK